tara:strand:- start:1 stop:984 length:984 start_codon:yes stop_codon:yes gene_type:complete
MIRNIFLGSFMMFFSFAQAESQCERNFKDLIQNLNIHDFSNCDFDNFDFGKVACEAYNELGFDDSCTNGMRWTHDYALNFSGASLRGANFNFNGNSTNGNPYNFTGADLSGVDFTYARFDNVTFQAANLSGAIMGTSFDTPTNFSGANFSGANLLQFTANKANFTGAIMNGIIVPNLQDYPGSDFTGVISNNIRYEDGEIVHQPDFFLDYGDGEWVISEGKIINVNWGGSMPPSVSQGGDVESESSDPNESLDELNQNREYLSSKENFIQNERRLVQDFDFYLSEGDSTIPMFPMFYDLDANGDGSIELYEYQNFFIFGGAPRDSLE